MKIKLIKNYTPEIIKLYEEIKLNTFTLWDNDYPSEELIKFDIARNGLWGVFEGKKLIAVSFAGQRIEDGEESFTWKHNFKKRGTFARIGVDPKFQHKGVATQLVKFIIENLKEEGFDGVRILVGTNNFNALKLYDKFGFENCGEVERFDHKYYLYELSLI